MEIINGKTAMFSMLEQDILLVVMKEDAEVDVSDIRENYEIIMHITSGHRYASLVDARKFATITSEAREYSVQSEMHINIVAQAIVITSLASRLLANSWIQFFKKNNGTEIKLFDNYEIALGWLKEKLVENKNGKKRITNKTISEDKLRC